MVLLNPVDTSYYTDTDLMVKYTLKRSPAGSVICQSGNTSEAPLEGDCTHLASPEKRSQVNFC